MRLHRHDEIVEAMALGIMGLKGWGHMEGNGMQALSRKDATAALDALLSAVVEKKVGELTTIEIGQYPDRIDTVGRLILKLEPKP
jgi:hypothetical protein